MVEPAGWAGAGLAALTGAALGPFLARFAAAQIAALEAQEAAGQAGPELRDAWRRCRGPDAGQVPRHWQLAYAAAMALAFGGGALLGGVFLALAFGLAAFAALLDLRAFWLPDSVTRPLLALGLLGAALGLAPVALADALLGMAVAWVLVMALQQQARRRLEGAALGGGDVKFVTACGALCGLSGLPLFLGLLAAGAAILNLSWPGGTGRKADWLPFGSAIAAAWICATSLVVAGR